ncbi:MAG: dihydroorotate dehydrogenase [Candidatus Omnitrophica bacterium]|nr:dihydroorotate dehydrogenase [Candidatus Omnitrophota bacterium]
MKKVDLTTKIKNVIFKNPVTVASGTFGTTGEYSRYVNYNRLGAIITKTITVNPRLGNPMPRICETSSGMLNAIGLQNKGLADFIENKIPYYARIKSPLIVNIAGESEGDFAKLTAVLNKHKKVVRMIELNLSCPNVEKGGAGFMKKRRLIKQAVRAARSETDMPLMAKLSPELGDVLEIAGEVLDSGASGLSLINTLKGMSIDIEKRCSRIANITGGLSGPAIKPVALRYVYEVKKHYDVPVIASGGIMNARDAVEFLIAGATLLAVGTANFVNPRSTLDILEGLTDYCRQQGIRQIGQLRGSFHHVRPES